MTDGIDDEGYQRPADVDGSFAPDDSSEHQGTQPSADSPSARPPAVSPQEQAVFSRPPGGGAYAPAPGERLGPRPTDRSPAPQVFADAFGPTPDAQDGYAPAPGDRLPPRGPVPPSPWWKADAVRDPWRDPRSPHWLGRPAVLVAGRPEQLDPDADSEMSEDVVSPPADGDAEELDSGKVRRVRFGRSTWVITLIVALVAGGLGGGVGWWLTDHVHDALHRPDVSIAQAHNPVVRPPTSVAGIAKRVGPAVVSIAVKTPDEFAIGSGVVIEKNGYVLTNNHVVAGAVLAKNASVVVTFSNEATAKAQIVGVDPTSDLAVIKVPNTDLTVAQLGDSDKLAVGDPVIAIGSPLGLQGTVTAGIVSALNRPVKASGEDGTSAYLSAIQTDAPINPGNSGGALVDAAGAVVGINSAGRFAISDGSGSEIPVSGIGYAIPINHARQVALELIHSGHATHGAIGMQGVTVLSGLQVGGYVKQVSPGGPAAKAGLRPGDVIVVVDNTAVQTFDQIIVIVQQRQPGDKINLTYYRGSRKLTTTVILGKG